MGLVYSQKVYTILGNRTRGKIHNNTVQALCRPHTKHSADTVQNTVQTLCRPHTKYTVDTVLTLCGSHTKHCTDPVWTLYKTQCGHCADPVQTPHKLHCRHIAYPVWTLHKTLYRPCVDPKQNTVVPVWTPYKMLCGYCVDPIQNNLCHMYIIVYYIIYMFININLNTFPKCTNFITFHLYTNVTAVTNGAIKVTLNGTTHNRTLVNSLPDQ